MHKHSPASVSEVESPTGVSMQLRWQGKDSCAQANLGNLNHVEIPDLPGESVQNASCWGPDAWSVNVGF